MVRPALLLETQGHYLQTWQPNRMPDIADEQNAFQHAQSRNNGFILESNMLCLHLGHRDFAVPGSLQSCHIDQVSQVGAAEAGTAARDGLQRQAEQPVVRDHIGQPQAVVGRPGTAGR